MSTRRTLEEQIEQAQKELKQKEARIKELLGRQRSRADKDRTRRLCERGGKPYPETDTPCRRLRFADKGITVLL